jgi:hypothetical protein
MSPALGIPYFRVIGGDRRNRVPLHFVAVGGVSLAQRNPSQTCRVVME